MSVKKSWRPLTGSSSARCELGSPQLTGRGRRAVLLCPAERRRHHQGSTGCIAATSTWPTQCREELRAAAPRAVRTASTRDRTCRWNRRAVRSHAGTTATTPRRRGTAARSPDVRLARTSTRPPNSWDESRSCAGSLTVEATSRTSQSRVEIVRQAVEVES